MSEKREKVLADYIVQLVSRVVCSLCTDGAKKVVSSLCGVLSVPVICVRAVCQRGEKMCWLTTYKW